MTRARRILLGVVTVLVVAAAAVVLIGVWWASSLYQHQQTDAAHAAAAFDEIRQRFPQADPAFAIRDTRLVMARPPAPPSRTGPAAMHILVWQPRERTLSRLVLPLWISRVATEPLPLEALAGVGQQGLGGLMEGRARGNELNIRMSDLERYGRTLLLDGVTADGKHVLMWSE